MTNEIIFTITLGQMAALTSAAMERDRLRVQLREAEAALKRKREELARHQSVFERRDIKIETENERK